MKMNMWLRQVLALAYLAVAGSTLFALTNEDVLKMDASGLSEETILLAIRNAPEKDFDTSATGLTELKAAGLSERIIQEMIVGAGRPATRSDPAPRDTGHHMAMEFKDVPNHMVMPPVIAPEVGGSYYTRINFWYERGKSSATNYERGTLVPVNTEVKLVSVRGKSFVIRTAHGETVEIVNVPEFTRASIPELLARYLADQQTRLELYGDAAAKQILAGVMRIGMTKDQVLLTRGYPPLHETASLDSDRWVYWSSRFVKLTVAFSDGRVERGRGLY